MNRQLTTILIVCLVAEQIKKLRVDHANQEVKGGIRVRHNQKKCSLSISQHIQFQFIVHGTVAQFLNIKGREPCAAGNQDGFCRFTGNEAVQEYYNGVHTLSNNDFVAAIYAVVSVLMGQPELRTQNVKEFLPFMFQPDIRYFTEPSFERDIPVAMIEQRYQVENEMLEAVSRGDDTAAMLCIRQYSRFSLGDRFIGTLYREKSQFIIMNTLLRKAIEQNAVHPFYVDKISSSYARRIEALDTVEDVQATLQQMIRDYCAYARRYSLKGYSPTVQKVINHINLNLSEPHTLKSLAALCHISPSYLSSLFKQETGSTLIDYINTQRVKRAAQQLTTTDRSISEVAEEMGILDVNYFAKIFKRTFGMTPTRYRRENRKK